MNWKEIDTVLSERLTALRKMLVWCDCPEEQRVIKDKIRATKWELESHRGDGCEL